MAEIHIASSLAPYAGGARRLTLDGATVEDVLERLGERYPEFRARAFDGDGALRPHITLFLNRTQISGNGGFGSVVSDGDEIAIISAIAGG
jgi:molybdopterin converting factor small subunit